MLARYHRVSYQQAAAHPFDGVVAIGIHLDQRCQLEDYVNGSTKTLPGVPTACHASCMVGKWLHGEGGNSCTDIALLDSLCKSCEEFREAAGQAVLLTSIGETELAKAALQIGERYSEASEQFQLNLLRLHQRYSGMAGSRQ